MLVLLFLLLLLMLVIVLLIPLIAILGPILVTISLPFLIVKLLCDSSQTNEKKIQKAAFKKCQGYYNNTIDKMPTKEEREVTKDYIKQLVRQDERLGKDKYSEKIKDAILKNNALEDYEFFSSYFTDFDNLENHIKNTDI